MTAEEARRILKDGDPADAQRVEEALLVLDGCPADQVDLVLRRRRVQRDGMRRSPLATDLRDEYFRISGNPDDQLLLALVICTGKQVGVGSFDFHEFLAEHREPGSIHPNIDKGWSSPWNVQRALSRLRDRGLVLGGPVAFGELSTWRVTTRGFEFLASRRLFEVTNQERRRRARQRRKAA